MEIVQENKIGRSGTNMKKIIFVLAELIDGDSLNRRFYQTDWGIEPQLFEAELIFRLIITRQILSGVNSG